MIKPTVGRIVNYIPQLPSIVAFDPKQPLASIITYVHSDRCINLAYFDTNGVSFYQTSVILLQDDDLKPEGGRFAYWMEYQKGQAAKYEALEASTK